MSINKLSIKGMFIALIVGVAFVLLPFNVMASANPVIEVKSQSGLSAIEDEVNTISNKTKFPFKFFTFKQSSTDPSVYIVTLDMQGYNNVDITSSNRQAIMQTALSSITKNNNISSQNKTRLYNFVASQDTATSSLVRQLSNDVNADFATAYSWFKPFSGGISTVLGLFSLVIFVMLTFMILFDLSYLVIPPIRALLESSTGEKPKFVSNEAYNSVKEAEKDNTVYRSYLGIYLKHKSGQIVILSICLLYLVSGKIYLLVGWFIDSFQSMLG